MIILDLFSAVARYPKHSKIKRFMQNKLDIAFEMRYTAPAWCFRPEPFQCARKPEEVAVRLN